MTTGSKKGGLDTADIDGGWGEESEPIPPAKPATPTPTPAPKPLAAPKPLTPLAPRPVTPRAQKAPKVTDPEAALPPDDEIEYEAEVVTRDSMPTFQHPNPLQFDMVPPSERSPKVPKPPPLPKISKRRKR